jgi:hypothetical protein
LVAEASTLVAPLPSLVRFWFLIPPASVDLDILIDIISQSIKCPGTLRAL